MLESTDQLVIISLILFVLLYLVYSVVMKKILKVEKKTSLFSVTYVNERHRKINRAISLVSLMVLAGSFIILYTQYEQLVNPIWYMTVMALITLLSSIILEVVRAYMEWKYDKKNRGYLLTISQIIFILVFVSIFAVTFVPTVM